MKPFPVHGSDNHIVLLGQSLTLACPIQAIPPPSYAWFHYDPTHSQGSPITDHAKFQVEINGSLHVQTFEISDFGHDCAAVLLCQATNPAGEGSFFHTVSLNKTECQTIAETPLASPHPSVRPSPVSDLDPPRDDDVLEDEDSDVKMVLTVVFSVVLAVLFVAVVSIFAYLLRLYRFR